MGVNIRILQHGQRFEKIEVKCPRCGTAAEIEAFRDGEKFQIEGFRDPRVCDNCDAVFRLQVRWVIEAAPFEETDK